MSEALPVSLELGVEVIDLRPPSFDDLPLQLVGQDHGLELVVELPLRLPQPLVPRLQLGEPTECPWQIR